MAEEKCSDPETLDPATLPGNERVKYGWLACRPPFLQSCLSAGWVISSASFLVFCQQFVVTGISNVVVTSIEKRFFLKSSQVGVVFSCFDIGNLLLTVVVSYFGYRHKPKWLGCGALVFALGCVLFILPQFLASKYEPIVSQERDLCQTVLNRTNVSSTATKNYSTFPEDADLPCRGTKWFLMMLLVVGQLVIGAGSSPIFNLGPSYLDENVSLKNSGLCLGMFYSIAALGSGTGFILGGYFLAIYVDFVQVL